MDRDIKKIFCGLSFLALLTFSVVGIFGMTMTMPAGDHTMMPASDHTMMVECPLMADTVAICPMSLSEHIAQWQALFTVIPQPSLVFLLLALSVVGVLVWVLLQRRLLNYWYYKEKQHKIPSSHALLTALSDGILQPLLYH